MERSLLRIISQCFNPCKGEITMLRTFVTIFPATTALERIALTLALSEWVMIARYVQTSMA